MELNLPIRIADGIELATSEEAVETPVQDVPADSALSNQYITSVLETVEIEDKIEEDDLSSLPSSEEEKPKGRSRRRAAAAKPPRAKPSPGPKHPLVEAAEDKAASYQATHTTTRATFLQLRAYYLWHGTELKPEAVARLLRDPPLADSTVITYVLSALHRERRLPYDQERLRHELARPLIPYLRMKWPLIVEALRGFDD